MIIVFTTTPTSAEAETLAGSIIEAKLAACVQILPQIKSIYFWDGAVRRESEQLLLIKTRKKLFSELETLIRSKHSYEVPEITAVKASGVSKEYAEWLKKSVG